MSLGAGVYGVQNMRKYKLGVGGRTSVRSPTMLTPDVTEAVKVLVIWLSLKHFCLMGN